MMDLVIGRDNLKVFPEFAQEAMYKKDDLVLCSIRLVQDRRSMGTPRSASTG